MNNKERLKVYIDSDTSYQEYKQGKDGFTDVEMVNIEHCKDIEELLEENDNLYAINEEHKKLNGELRDKVKHLRREKLVYTCMDCGKEFETNENDMCPYCHSANVHWGV